MALGCSTRKDFIQEVRVKLASRRLPSSAGPSWEHDGTMLMVQGRLVQRPGIKKCRENLKGLPGMSRASLGGDSRRHRTPAMSPPSDDLSALDAAQTGRRDARFAHRG